MARTLLRRWAAHLLRRDELGGVVDSIEMEVGFSYAIDMHAAINHEHTTDDAAIAKHTSTWRNLCLYICIYLPMCDFSIQVDSVSICFDEFSLLLTYWEGCEEVVV